MTGRVRGVTGRSRVALDRGWHVAAAPAGSIVPMPGGSSLDPGVLDGLRWVPATVPGTAAGALRAAGLWSWDERRAFDAEDWWWRVPLEGATGVLGIDGIATLWDAWVDGEWIGHGDSMFRAHELDLPAAGRELVIRCRALDVELAKKRARPRWRVPMLEQQQLRWIRTTLLGRTPGWSPPCPAVGPWRPVWIESRPAFHVGEVTLDARLEGGVGFATVGAQLGDGVERATLVLRRADRRHAHPLAHEQGAWIGTLAIDAPDRWWPHTHGEPSVYQASIEAERGGEKITIDLGPTGFRSIAVEQAGGDFQVRVNDVPVFCRGACWTPLDPVTLGASPVAYRAAVAQLVDAGMNMVRVGGTMVYEDPALYDALDEQGVLLWQDLMFANMDYPEDAGFVDTVRIEVAQQLGKLQARPSLAVVCGNSEGEQQAAMWGAPRERWSPPLFHEVLAQAVRSRVPGIPYTPSSAHGGAFPHAANAGPSSYYGVGAYLRPLDDARRSEVRFASECLAFANIPAPGGLPGGAALRVHHPAWKARSPRDLGAGWDFDDVRDHYVQRLYGVDPVALRVADHERYLALGRAATGEVMAQTFAEWRRARSSCRGGLIWWLRDLWPGAGWGVIDAHGAPKPAWYALRRALAPIALAITDEGVNGLALHVVNDRGAPLAGRVELALWRAGDIQVGRAGGDVAVAAHGAIELPAAALLEGFLDLSFAYRFGPPVAQVVHATLEVYPEGRAEPAPLHLGGARAAEAFWFPAGLPATREVNVGLAAKAVEHGDRGELEVRTQRFAQSVSIEIPGWIPDDDGFHLAPGQVRTIGLRRVAFGAPRGHVTALNAESGARVEVPT